MRLFNTALHVLSINMFHSAVLILFPHGVALADLKDGLMIPEELLCF
jgi:hypothetical protein